MSELTLMERDGLRIRKRVLPLHLTFSIIKKTLPAKSWHELEYKSQYNGQKANFSHILPTHAPEKG